MTADPTTGDADGAREALPLVEVILEDSRWAEIGLSELADAAAGAVLTEFGMVPQDCEISLLACDDRRIAALNSQFRGKESPTNVLSWPSGEWEDLQGGAGPIFLGDMALAYETCTREAAEAGLALPAHVTHLIVHGVLHLLGHDHQDDKEASDMEQMEAKILASMGIENPYR